MHLEFSAQQPAKMGCISSKMMSRSLSYGEEMNQRTRRSANSNPVSKELAVSENINNQFLALVHTANTVAIKLRSGSFSNKCSKPAFEPNITRTSSNALECMSSTEQWEAKQAEPEASMLLPQILRDDLIKQATSRHWLLGSEERSQSPESFNENKDEKWNYKSVGPARSFHTVEEYDTLIEKIRLSGAQIASDREDDSPIFKVQLNNSNSLLSLHDEDSSELKRLEEKPMIEKTSTLSSSELKREKQDSNPSKSSEAHQLHIDKSAPEEHVLQKGFRRKSIAKKLESLEIPQTVEFPAFASLGEGSMLEDKYTLLELVTPKFGSYSLPNTDTSNECNEVDIFNPELVAACEECMQQLEAEAESILRQIADSMEEESSMEKQAKDET